MILSHYGAFLTKYLHRCHKYAYQLFFSEKLQFQKENWADPHNLLRMEYWIGSRGFHFFTNSEIFRIPEKFTQWFLCSKISMS